MDGTYKMEDLPTVMGKMGIDVAKNIMQVNNALLDDSGASYIVDDVEFKPRYPDMFSVVRHVHKQQKTWNFINKWNVAEALDRHGAGEHTIGNVNGRIDEWTCKVIADDLRRGDVVEFRGLKLKPDKQGYGKSGFRVYDNRDKVTA